MKKLSWSYEYQDTIDNQYTYEECTEFGFVDAKYVQSPCADFRGNPFIEALPLPRTKDDVVAAYTKPLLSYDRDEVMNMNVLQRKASAISIRKVRFCLGFHKDLEFINYDSIINSYAMRNLYYWENSSYVEFLDDMESKMNTKSIGKANDAAPSGFSLLGFSGCGKSASLEILFNHIPQVIVHHPKENVSMIQVTYLVVNCLPNSNFSGLYSAIARALDSALGNLNMTYEKMISKKRSLADKQALVCQWIQNFNIGTIVLDEIQLINFDSNRENSYEALMTIVNNTKIALSVVGTDDAYSQLFAKARNARRSGVYISAMKYTENVDYFHLITRSLFKYQWFDEPVKWTKELSETMYECTKGVIDQVTWLYKYINLDYLDAKEMGRKVVINSDFIKKIYKKHFKQMVAHLEYLNREFEAEEDMIIMKKALEAENSQDQFMKDIAESEESMDEENKTLSEVIRIIQQLYPKYTKEKIADAFRIVIKHTKTKVLEVSELAQKTLKQLEKKPKKTKAKQIDGNPKDLNSYIN